MEGQIRTYCINLKSRPDRMARFLAQPELEVYRQQYPIFERFEAVRGNDIDVANDTRISLRTKRNILKGERRAHEELESAGGVGCYLSHVEIWRKFLETPEQYLIVFEDDAVIPPGFTRNLQAAMKEVTVLPKTPDIWWFDQNVWIPAMPGDPHELKGTKYNAGNWITETCTTTAGYMLTKASAHKLLEFAFPVEMHVDAYMCVVRNLKSLFSVSHKNVSVKQYALKVSDTDIHIHRECAICDIPNDFKSKGMVVVHLPMLAMGIAAAAGLWWLSSGGKRRR